MERKQLTEPEQSTELEESAESEEFIEPVRYDVSKASPSILKPFERTAEERIQQLEKYLTYDHHWNRLVNIRALIKLYEIGVIKSFRGPPDGTCVHICNGQNYGDRCPTDEETKGHAVWTEKVYQQMILQGPPMSDSKLVNQQMSVWSTYSTSAGTMHTFQVMLRLRPQDELDAIESRDVPDTKEWRRARKERDAKYPTQAIQIANDTGSNLLSVFRSDLEALNYEAYQPKVEESITVTTAMGPVERTKLTVQLKVIDNKGYGMTRWFDEEAIILEEAVDGLQRLSGKNIRTELYFATGLEHRLFAGLSENAYMK